MLRRTAWRRSRETATGVSSPAGNEIVFPLGFLPDAPALVSPGTEWPWQRRWPWAHCSPTRVLQVWEQQWPLADTDLGALP